MKKYTVIKTKHGNALLLLQSDDDNANLLRFPYLGSHPEGTVLSEEQVKEIKQYRKIDIDYEFEWTTCASEQTLHATDIRPYFETHITYTDAEPHDRHIRPFNTHNVRPLVDQLVGEEISFSRFIELLNGIANTH